MSVRTIEIGRELASRGLVSFIEQEQARSESRESRINDLAYGRPILLPDASSGISYQPCGGGRRVVRRNSGKIYNGN